MSFSRYSILLWNARNCVQCAKFISRVITRQYSDILYSSTSPQRHSLSNLNTKYKIESQHSITNEVISNVELHNFDPQIPGALETSNEDLSYLGKNVSPSYNVAAYANQSELIQQFVKLGVKVYKFDKNPELAEEILKLNFEKDVKPYIQFLHDCGVPADQLGNFFSKNPMILKQDLDDLCTRIRYLRVRLFTKDMIARIVTRNPLWLMRDTKKIDERLGYFQHQYKLTGSETRKVATMEPRLITLDPVHLVNSEFAITQEMGFSDSEAKNIILLRPRIWMMNRQKIVESFDFAHNEMKLSHEILSKQPDVLTCRKNRLQARHKFLQELRLVQYDPSKPKYISPKAVISGSDVEFCTNVAKVAVDTYNLFLKTL